MLQYRSESDSCFFCVTFNIDNFDDYNSKGNLEAVLRSITLITIGSIRGGTILLITPPLTVKETILLIHPPLTVRRGGLFY